MNTKRPIASLVSLAIVGVASIVFAAAPGCPDFEETDLFFRITGAGDDHAVLKVNTSTAVDTPA